jgi:hypothetical protein
VAESRNGHLEVEYLEYLTRLAREDRQAPAARYEFVPQRRQHPVTFGFDRGFVSLLAGLAQASQQVHCLCDIAVV